MMTDAEKKLLQAQHRLEEAQARDRVKERKARTRRLIQEGAILEKVLPEVRTMDLPMTTRDGYHWEGEMASRQNRHHPFVAVAYCYCVKDAEGKVLRRESLASARQYVFDESKNFYFQDRCFLV